jgi:hypothetical protein
MGIRREQVIGGGPPPWAGLLAANQPAWDQPAWDQPAWDCTLNFRHLDFVCELRISSLGKRSA